MSSLKNLVSIDVGLKPLDKMGILNTYNKVTIKHTYTDANGVIQNQLKITTTPVQKYDWAQELLLITADMTFPKNAIMMKG